jgi:hypothetical protein
VVDQEVLGTRVEQFAQVVSRVWRVPVSVPFELLTRLAMLFDPSEVVYADAAISVADVGVAEGAFCAITDKVISVAEIVAGSEADDRVSINAWPRRTLTAVSIPTAANVDAWHNVPGHGWPFGAQATFTFDLPSRTLSLPLSADKATPDGRRATAEIVQSLLADLGR